MGAFEELPTCTSCGRGVHTEEQECGDCIREWMSRNGFEE